MLKSNGAITEPCGTPYSLLKISYSNINPNSVCVISIG